MDGRGRRMDHVNVVWATVVVALVVAASAWAIGLVVAGARREWRHSPHS